MAAVSRPDICARLANIASRITSPCGSDVYRINVLARAAKEWQKATVLKYALPSDPWKSVGLEGKAKNNLRKGGEVALRNVVFSGMVGRRVWGPVDGNKVPIRIRDRPGAVAVYWAAPCFGVDIQSRRETG